MTAPDAVSNPQIPVPNGTGHTYTPNSLNQLADVTTIVNGTPVESVGNKGRAVHMCRMRNLKIGGANL